jgi:Uma2 family endonuclease
MAITEQITTGEQLLQAAGLGRCELVRGELRMMTPAGAEHGAIALRIGGRLLAHVESQKLGKAFGAETGFLIARDPDTVRAPDVAFVRAERIGRSLPQGFFEGPPDLAVEVISPGDRESEVGLKIQDWLNAGCRIVWRVDPRALCVTVHRGREKPVILRGGDTLSGDDVVRGFTLPVAEIFA